MTDIAAGPLTLAGLFSTNEVVPSSLPVDLSTATWRTMLRVVVPVQPGDVLDVSAWFRVTNDISPDRYVVGVGAHLWQYDTDSGQGSAGPWSRLDVEAGSVGMNVDKVLHHLTMGVAVPYVVPADWPVGHRMTVALRADAHSTAYLRNGGGDVLTVDQCGRLTVRRYQQTQEV